MPICQTVSYRYNALGQHVRKSLGSTTTHYFYDDNGKLIGEYDSNGNLLQETAWLDDMPVLTLRPPASGSVAGNAQPYYVHADHLGTPRRITRPVDDAVMWQWGSEPFGSTASSENPQNQGTFVYHLRFAGQYYDTKTGLAYNYFRDYDAETGRYVQSDPIGLAGGVNTYGYVGGNPVSGTDPEGLETKMCTKPLHALGDNLGPALYPESKWNPSPLYHQFVCISDGKGGYKCGGQDRQEGPWSSGKQSDDHYKPEQCKQVEPDNNCIERCIGK